MTGKIVFKSGFKKLKVTYLRKKNKIKKQEKKTKVTSGDSSDINVVKRFS